MSPADRAVERERLDRVLVRRGLASTRAKAQALILAGRVRLGGQRMDKPGARVATDAPLEVLPGRRYVGRGGHKLAFALDAFDLRVTGRDALDVGASTGGFTQVLLDAGAARVAALDVGRGQLDWTLRRDPRVTPVEGVNARYLTVAMLPFRPSLAVIDVSFISLELVLPPVAACLADGGEIVALVKPQFEVGRGEVGRGGIVRRPEARRRVLERLIRFLDGQRWGVRGVIASPITGAEGNFEYFVHIDPGGRGLDDAGLARAIGAALAATEEEAK